MQFSGKQVIEHQPLEAGGFERAGRQQVGPRADHQRAVAGIVGQPAMGSFHQSGVFQRNHVEQRAHPQMDALTGEEVTRLLDKINVWKM